MNENNKRKTAAVAAIAAVIGVILGYLLGAQAGRDAAAEEREKAEELQKSLNVFVPPLPEVVNVVSGKITAVNGESFALEIPSFTDRYPHPDTPPATETKTIKTTGDTKITEMSFDPKTFKDGLPKQTALKFSDLKTGDFVTVTVSENARAVQNLTAVNINKTGGM